MFENFSAIDYMFFIAAVFSTFFFVLRVIMMFAGGVMDADASSDGLHADVSHDGMNGDASTDVPHDTDNTGSFDSFHILSINSITAFIMMFGWIGLASHRQFLLEESVSIFFAFLAGASAMVATAYLFSVAMKLTSAGDVFDINDLVGKKGSVYLRIDPIQGGKIQISGDDNITRELDAFSYDKTLIDSFSTVEVVEVINGSTVYVIKI